MRTVAIYGNSLALSSVRASLEQRAGLRVLGFDPTQPGASERLSVAHPDVIVFDLASRQSDSAVALWKAQPHVVLIGLDVAADHVLVLSGQSSQVLTADDLVQVIEARAPADTKE
jgi:hypothetical protein